MFLFSRTSKMLHTTIKLLDYKLNTLIKDFNNILAAFDSNSNLYNNIVPCDKCKYLILKTDGISLGFSLVSGWDEGDTIEKFHCKNCAKNLKKKKKKR